MAQKHKWGRPRGALEHAHDPNHIDRMTTQPFHTIGHSTRPLDAFVAMLREAAVTLVVDVRSVPRSRTNPQYNRETLPDALAAFGIAYEHMAALGGLRGRNREVPPELNGFWENDSFHNYADYAMGEEFRRGFDRLRELGAAQRCAIMCAEAVWWRCHRRIIADYLLAEGETVQHIMGSGHIDPARITEAAQRDPSGCLVYPPQQPELRL
jgi:uncharacterized protein (DUF488 family)